MREFDFFFLPFKPNERVIVYLFYYSVTVFLQFYCALSLELVIFGFIVCCVLGVLEPVSVSTDNFGKFERLYSSRTGWGSFDSFETLR